MSPRITACFVVALAAACADEPGTHVDTMLEPTPDAAVSGDILTAVEPAPAVACTPEQSAHPLPLAMFPPAPPNGPGISIFRHHNASCNRQPVQVVIHNTSPQALHIEGMRIDDPNFSVQGPAVPFTLAPDDIAALRIGFQSEIGEFKPKLSIAAAEGCATFPITGRTIDPATSGIVMPQPGVLSFGHVARGSTSEPLEFTLIEQARRGEESTTMGSISSASASVRVEPLPDTALNAEACELRKARVRLVAPNTPGLVHGTLSYETHDAEFSALSFSDVVGYVD